MNKFLIKVVLLVMICLQNPLARGQSAQLPTVHDSLRSFLIYFEKNTRDEKLLSALIETSRLYSGNSINDSLTGKLITVENLLKNIIEENLLMNFKPFRRDTVFGFAEKLVKLLEPLKNNQESNYYATALNNLGSMYLFFGNSQKEIPLFEKAFAIRKINLREEHPDYSESLNNMAIVHWSRGNKSEALHLLNKSLAITRKTVGETHQNYTNGLFLLATFCRQMHKKDTAILLYDQEIKIKRKILGAGNEHYALSLYRNAEILLEMNEYSKANLLYQEALEITRKTQGEESLQFAYCLDGIGSYYYRIAEYAKAVPLYQRSLAIKEKLFGEEYSDNALSLHNLATTFIKMGQYAKAFPLFQKASEIAKKALEEGIEFDFNYAFSINQLAAIYQTLHQYAPALALLEKALAVTGKSLGEEHPYYAIGLSYLAVLNENIGRYDSALKYYKKALDIRKKVFGEENLLYAKSLNNMAFLYNKTEQYDTAMTLSKQTTQILKNILGNEHPDYAASLNNLGDLYMKIAYFDSAFYYLGEALRIRKNILGDNHPDYVKSLHSKALLNLALGNEIPASSLFAEANKIQLDLILRTYTSLSEQEKMNFIKEEYYQFSYLPSLLYKNDTIPGPGIKQQVYLNELVLKGMILEEQRQILNSIRKSGDSIAMQLYIKWRGYKSFLGQQLLLPINQRDINLHSIEDSANNLDQQLSRRSSEFQRQNQVISLKDIGRTLEKGQAAVEFLKFRYYNNKWTDSTLYAAMVILPGDSIGTFISLFEERQLQSLLNASRSGEAWAVNKLYRRHLEDKNHPDNHTNALYYLIWKPLEKYLKEVRTIIYAPVGLLNRISFQAISSGNNRLLIDKYVMRQVISTRSLVMPLREKFKPSSASIWGNIRYNPTNVFLSRALIKEKEKSNGLVAALNSTFIPASRGEPWKSLPGTKKEIDSLQRLFVKAGINIHTVSDTNATEEKFKSFDGESPQVLHMATHGFFLAEKNIDTGGTNTIEVPSDAMFRTGLILAGGNYSWEKETSLPGMDDGILRAYEIAHMDLSNTELAVLSACNTALGDLNEREGVIGLQRAFKMAGVNQLVISLWRIPDKETIELMTAFYRYWLNGKSIPEALRSAQLKLKEKYPSPYYWAAFVLTE